MNLHHYTDITANSGVPQVISFTAPTGSGKTIIVSALLEDIFKGSELFEEKPNSIVIWLSDSPQLNEQSKIKIETKADKIGVNRCITLSDDTFDKEMLDDGYIYFLNTQKLGKSSKLVQLRDGREHTIWETIQNTIENKSDRLLMVIDEAHRGSLGTEAGRATTIMQKFILGSPKDNLKPIPVVIGMSATVDRFNRLVGATESTIRPVTVTADAVRKSGLIKDRIIVVYPKANAQNDDVSLLQAATDEWKAKCEHWHRFTVSQHYANIDPVFIIQVLNGTKGKVTNTNLNDCLEKIEGRLNYKFSEGEVVHAFGATGDITINGLTVHYVEPSDIADNKKIKIVFFKESLSTGWDCPRAETMMSFRTAEDPTWIAQLLGRMIRTPRHERILLDESLNDVRLYLPHFNAETVHGIIETLQCEEGGDIPTVIEDEEYENPTFAIWSAPKSVNKPKDDNPLQNQTSIFDNNGFGGLFTPQDQKSDDGEDSHPVYDVTVKGGLSFSENIPTPGVGTPAINFPENVPKANNPVIKTEVEPIPQGVQLKITKAVDIDRNEIVDHINHLGIVTYKVMDTSVCSYLESALNMAHLLARTEINDDAIDQIVDNIVEMIHKHSVSLKVANVYEEKVQKVIEMELSQQIYDALSLKELYKDQQLSMFMTSDSDLDRKLRMADHKLGNWGIDKSYGKKYYDEQNPQSFKFDVILFVSNDDNLKQLSKYAETTFHKLCDENRIYITSLSQKYKNEYDRIASNADSVSKHNWEIPYSLSVKIDPDGKEYDNHLYVDGKTGKAKIKLNSWEEGLLEEESKKNDFVCWLRNVSRASWSLQLPYEIENLTKAMYPDFIMVRADEKLGYVVDIMEPHGDHFKDNINKAKGLAKYAMENSQIGRIQMVRLQNDEIGNKKFRRLDLAKSETRDRVLKAVNNDELDHLFDTIGFFED